MTTVEFEDIDLDNFEGLTGSEEIITCERIYRHGVTRNLDRGCLSPRFIISNIWQTYLISDKYDLLGCNVDIESEDIIELRELSKKEAKKEILELLARKAGIGFYEVSTELRLELSFVVEACKELMDEGKLSSKEPS